MKLKNTTFKITNQDGQAGWINVHHTDTGFKSAAFYSDDLEYDLDRLATVGKYFPDLKPIDCQYPRDLMLEVHRLDRMVREESHDWANDEMQKRFGYSHAECDEAFNKIKTTAREQFYTRRVRELSNVGLPRK